MHACKIREPMDTKRWTMVEIGYALGTRPTHPGRRRQTSPGLPQHCDRKDNASVASSDDMSRSLEHRHKVRLYVGKTGLSNPADTVERAVLRKLA